VPLLGEPALSVPAMHRARAVMVLGARRPDHVLTLLAATANAEERSLAAAGVTLVAQGTYGPFVTWPTVLVADRLGVVPLPEAPLPFEPDPPKPVEKAEPLLAHMIQG